MPQPLDSKGESLRQQGVLNPHPQKVADPLFRDSEFFDPRDLVQVKYEMLRRVRVEGASVTEVTQAFGFSRPVFYQAQALYHRAGLPGLIPQRPGPRQAHKLSDLMVDFLLQHRLRDPLLRAHRALGVGSRAVRHRGPSPQHRTCPGAQTKKSPTMIPDAPRDQVPILPDQLWTTRYEEMRERAMAKSSSIDHAYGYALLIRRGLVAWMRAWPRPAPEPPAIGSPAPAAAGAHGPLASPPVSRLSVGQHDPLPRHPNGGSP